MSSCEELYSFLQCADRQPSEILNTLGFHLSKVLSLHLEIFFVFCDSHMALIFGKLAFSSVLLYSTKLEVTDNSPDLEFYLRSTIVCAV